MEKLEKVPRGKEPMLTCKDSPNGPVEGYEGPGTGNLIPEVDSITTLTNDHGGAPSDRQGQKSPGTPGYEVQPSQDSTIYVSDQEKPLL